MAKVSDAVKTERIARGKDAAVDLLWRMDIRDGQITDQAMHAVAWACEAFDMPQEMSDAMLDALKLKWEELPMGGWVLARKKD